MANVPKGELRFLIHKDSLHINTNSDSPLHAELGYLLGMLSKQIAFQILDADQENMSGLAARLVGRALLGGYCAKILDDPLTFRYTRGSTTVVAAKKEDFDKAQQTGNVVLVNHSQNDVYNSDLYLPYVNS